MQLSWKTRETHVTQRVEESYVEVRVDGQRWSYAIHTAGTMFGLEEHGDSVEVQIKINGVKTEAEGRRLCEMIAEVVGE